MKAKTIKRRRYATLDYDVTHRRVLRQVAEIRQVRSRMLLGGDTLSKLRGMLGARGTKPGVRRLLKGFVQTDMATLRQDGTLIELSALSEFMSPQARRNLEARVRARMAVQHG